MAAETQKVKRCLICGSRRQRNLKPFILYAVEVQGAFYSAYDTGKHICLRCLQNEPDGRVAFKPAYRYTTKNQQIRVKFRGD